MDAESRIIMILKTEAALSVEALESSFRLGLRGAQIKKTTKCTMYMFLQECTINNNACFIISLFTAQHVSNVSTSIFRSLRIIVDLFHVLYCSGSMCVGVAVWFGWVVWYPYAG